MNDNWKKLTSEELVAMHAKQVRETFEYMKNNHPEETIFTEKKKPLSQMFKQEHTREE